MQINEIVSEGLKRSYEIVVNHNELESELLKEITKIQSTASIPGFRKGKAPLKIIKSKYEHQVMPDVVSKIVDKSISNICNEKSLKPATKPQVEFKEFNSGEDLEFNVNFEIFPDFSDVTFDKLSVDHYKVSVSDEDINQVIEDLRKNMREMVETSDDYKIKEGDIAVIDFIGKIDGKPFDGGTGNGHELTIGSKQFIEGFESQLIGYKKGDEVTVKVKFPENYQAKELANKPAEFDVKIQSVKCYGDLPEIDEKFFSKIGSGIKTFEDLKEKVKLYKEKDYASASYSLSKKDLFDKLVDLLDTEVPQKLLEEELEIVKKMNPEDSDDENLKVAKRRVLLSLYFIRLSEDQHIHVSQQEIRNAILDQARNFPGMEMQVVELYSKNQSLLDQVRNSVLEDKVVNYILGMVNKNEIEISPKEFAEKI